MENSDENISPVAQKKTRKKRSRKTEKLDIDDPTYRITFTPTWVDKQRLKKMITVGVAKNITDAICQCIRNYPFPDVQTPEEVRDQKNREKTE